MALTQFESNKHTEHASAQANCNSTRNSRIHSVEWDRRRFLQTAGGLMVTGLLAGCTTNGASGSSGQDDENDPQSADEWLADTGNYDGVVDKMGEVSATVKVGAQGNNGANAFAPAAIEISPGTTVTWEWVNGYHNVVATGDQFSSGEPEQNATFEHKLDTVGTVYYYCEPNRSMGMKGAVIVSEGDSGGSQ